MDHARRIVVRSPVVASAAVVSLTLWTQAAAVRTQTPQSLRPASIGTEGKPFEGPSVTPLQNEGSSP